MRQAAGVARSPRGRRALGMQRLVFTEVLDEVAMLAGLGHEHRRHRGC
jgi:hypothetical protein